MYSLTTFVCPLNHRPRCGHNLLDLTPRLRPERQRRGVAQSVHKPFDRVVAPRESVLRDQILMDADRAQPLDECRSDDLEKS